MTTVFQTCTSCKRSRVHKWTTPVKLGCTICGKTTQAFYSPGPIVGYMEDPDWQADNAAKVIAREKKVTPIQEPEELFQSFLTRRSKS